MNLAGKIAIITGGSRGIGRAICLEFAAQGCFVGVNYQKDNIAAQQTLENLEKVGGSGCLLQADVVVKDEVEKVVDVVFSKCGKIDILVNSAGIIKDNLLLSMTDTEWQEVIDVNLTGVYNFTQVVAKYMVMSGSGKIINLTSISGQTGGKGQCNYAASKGAIDSFTRAVALELAPKGITVNGIAPGVIETDMTKDIRRVVETAIIAGIPLKRLGQPHEVAKAAAFLASAGANYITGEIINVTGGMNIGYRG